MVATPGLVLDRVPGGVLDCGLTTGAVFLLRHEPWHLTRPGRLFRLGWRPGWLFTQQSDGPPPLRAGGQTLSYAVRVINTRFDLAARWLPRAANVTLAVGVVLNFFTETKRAAALVLLAAVILIGVCVVIWEIRLEAVIRDIENRGKGTDD